MLTAKELRRTEISIQRMSFGSVEFELEQKNPHNQLPDATVPEAIFVDSVGMFKSSSVSDKLTQQQLTP